MKFGIKIAPAVISIKIISPRAPFKFTDRLADQFGAEYDKKFYKKTKVKLLEITQIDIHIQLKKFMIYFKKWKGSQKKLMTYVF
jgi:hypothetical protein